MREREKEKLENNKYNLYMFYIFYFMLNKMLIK